MTDTVKTKYSFRHLKRQTRETLYDYYCRLCILQKSSPHDAVKYCLLNGTLDFNVRRMLIQDWKPLARLFATASDKVNTIIIRNDPTRHALPVISKTKFEFVKKEVTYQVASTIKSILYTGNNVEKLAIIGIVLRKQDRRLLGDGLQANNTLQGLCLAYCQIGDQGLEQLARSLTSSRILSLDLSGCELSSKAAAVICDIIKHQCVTRQNTAWEGTLRYQAFNPDSVPGLRFLKLNDNPLLGNEGISLLAETMHDDMWIKSLELRQCGISQEGAESLLDLLEINGTILCIDLDGNTLIPEPVLGKIYHITLQRSENPPVDEWHAFQIDKLCALSGVCPQHGVKLRRPYSAMNLRQTTPDRPSRLAVHRPRSALVTSTYSSSTRNRQTKFKQEIHQLQEQISALSIETFVLREQCEVEKDGRREAEEELASLKVENERLQNTVDELTSELQSKAQMVNADAVEKIESSFKQFHEFLDILQNSTNEN